jgi:hypothetical protein
MSAVMSIYHLQRIVRSGTLLLMRLITMKTRLAVVVISKLMVMVMIVEVLVVIMEVLVLH